MALEHHGRKPCDIMLIENHGRHRGRGSPATSSFFGHMQALGRHESALIYTARRCMHFAAKVGEHHRLLNRARKAIVLAVARYIQMKG